MIAVIGDRETVIGFKLAGIKECFEFKEESLEEILNKIKEKKIVIINERIYEKLKERGIKLENIIVTIPDKYGPMGIDLLKDLTEKITGFEISV